MSVNMMYITCMHSFFKSIKILSVKSKYSIIELTNTKFFYGINFTIYLYVSVAFINQSVVISNKSVINDLKIVKLNSHPLLDITIETIHVVFKIFCRPLCTCYS